jgi:hypothetical protein
MVKIVKKRVNSNLGRIRKIWTEKCKFCGDEVKNNDYDG